MTKIITANKNFQLNDNYITSSNKIKQHAKNAQKILFINVNGVLACQHFANENYRCITFFSSKQAIEWLEKQTKNTQKHNILAIISDINSLKDTNFALLKYIKANKILKHTPLIIGSEQKVTTKERIFWLKKGIDDYYTIPINWQKLHHRILFLEKTKTVKKNISMNKMPVFTKKGLLLPRSKRTFDMVVAISGLILLSPLFLIIALLIKLESKGKVIYVSQRAGAACHIFDFYKFRTMYADADKKLRDLQHLNQYTFVEKENENAFIKLQNDPRVTRIGRFLRMTSLDELPQLINVLKGDMSLVGNRPLPLYEAHQLTRDTSAARFLAPAGITGQWQVSKRGKKEMSVEERIALDVKYAENYSFWKDLKIIFQTIPAMIQKETV